MRRVYLAALLGGWLASAEHATFAPPPQDRVLTLSEHDLRAAATQKVEPEYPAVARQIRLTGSVELEVVVDSSGTVEKVNILRGNTLLTGPSLQAIRKWKFKPFGTGVEPVRAAGPITFNFQM